MSASRQRAIGCKFGKDFQAASTNQRQPEKPNGLFYQRQSASPNPFSGCLLAQPRQPETYPHSESPTMQTQTLTIINKLGLHARASSKFVQTAAQYQSEIWVSKGEKRINGKSIMGLMMLAAAQGSTIQIEANGADEAQAVQALTALINDYFGEGE